MSNNYFSHDSNARNSDRVIPLRAKLQAEGYAIYFMILERLREEPDYTSVKDYNMLAFDFRVDAAKVKAVVEDFGLFSFTDNGKRFYSESFLRRMQAKDIKSVKARQSANCRWGKCERNANAQKTDANKEKKSKVKKENPSPKGEGKEKSGSAVPLPPTDPAGSEVNNPERDAQKTPPPTPSPAEKNTRRFIPPSVEQVEAYCQERGNGIDSQRWWDFYRSKGWKVGQSAMKDWKAAVRTWERREDYPTRSSGMQKFDIPSKSKVERDIDAVNGALDIVRARYGKNNPSDPTI